MICAKYGGISAKSGFLQYCPDKYFMQGRSMNVFRKINPKKTDKVSFFLFYTVDNRQLIWFQFNLACSNLGLLIGRLDPLLIKIPVSRE